MPKVVADGSGKGPADEPGGGRSAPRTPLAKQLALIPPDMAKAGLGGVTFGVAALVLCVAVFGMMTALAPDRPMQMILGGLTVLTVLLGVWAAVYLARMRRVFKGSETARQLWDPAWYCYGCETVSGSWPGGAALSLEDFRELVWTRGGYGHLHRRPARRGA